MDRKRNGDTVRAWRVIPETMPWEEEGIYAARSRAKARYQAWRASWEVGYCVPVGKLRVLRAPEFDCLAPELREGEGYNLSYAIVRRDCVRLEGGQ